MPDHFIDILLNTTFARSFIHVCMDTEKRETKEINKFSLLIVAVIVLVLILAGAGYYIFHQKQQMEGLVQTFDLEKESLEDEYNELSMTYEGYKFSVNNDSLVALLSTEQAKVQRLLEELRTVKATNAKEISRLKKELETLRKIMRNYVAQIDSLHKENTQLKEENKEVVKKFQQATSTAANLKKEKEKLTERVTLASRLDATDISVTPVNSRGKLAKKISKMQQFVVNFKIAKNITAPVGEKVLYVRIMKPDDDILVKSRGNVFAFEGKDINYSMKKLIEYEGEEVAVTMYWDIEEFLSPGTYRADIFADGNLIGRRSFELKD
ncbi:hypothetical protein SAMN05444001_11377 [Parabacteroides chinchillae]|uniref:Cell division protein ZapB n=2 Tax=Tannerellaceae TaxID=2005525 RepID=A0A8G2BXM0_9BACT|nr:hypothetical protein SAMN05444001_11377 [Parabacteroides chinchillae]